MVSWLSFASCTSTLFYGGLAQLARAPALQAGGQRFESVILHFSDTGSEWVREACNHNSQFPILNSQFGIVL